jgi:hypothetical protein
MNEGFHFGEPGFAGCSPFRGPAPPRWVRVRKGAL